MALVNTITELKESIDNYFNTIDRDQLIFLVNTIKNCSGTVFLTGIGKSGLIASVFAHMLMSIGTCSEFLDPVNALHGDVGKLRSSSIVIMFSKSGSNVELIELCENLKQRNVKTYLITCVKQSSLHAITNYTVFIPLDFETGSFSLAPLTSSILQLITSNIIVSELMKEISKEDYSLNHPGGSIGKKLTMRVKNVVRKVPMCTKDEKLLDILPRITGGMVGCILITSAVLEGIFTDGDLRRALEKYGSEALRKSMSVLMTENPITINIDDLAYNALVKMECNDKKSVKELVVLENNTPVGIVSLHDLALLFGC